MDIDSRRPSELVPFATAQIIAAALIASPLLLAAMAYAVARGQKPQQPAFGYAALGFAAISVVVSTVAPTLATKDQLKKLRAERDGELTLPLFGVFQTRLIARSAILEGGALFCCVVYLGTAIWSSLVAALVLVGIMAIRFPTRGQFDDWYREQCELASLES